MNNFIRLKVKLIFLIFLFSSLYSFAQIKYEHGYFIDNDGSRIDCLIKDVGWNDNPDKFEFKLTENADAKIIGVDDVIEFGISDFLKYERHITKIDRSSDIVTKLSSQRAPEYETKKVFLKVLVEGKADLLVYQDRDVNRFYYSLNDTGVELLVFKRYIDYEIKDIVRNVPQQYVRTNNQFKQQLKSNLNCDSFSDARFNLMDYRASFLEPYFVNYNYCEKSSVIQYSGRKKRDWFNLTMRLGMSHNSFSVGNESVLQSSIGIIGDYGSSISPRYGLEFEFFLPVNNNKWSLFLEPSYQEISIKKDGEIIYSLLEYKTIEIPIGFRHYVFLSKKSKLFFNASFAFVHNGDSRITNFRVSNGNETGFREINGTEEYYSLGMGYNFNNKLSLEFRYNTKRDLLGDTKFYTSTFNESFSVILGYSIF